jgi:hypothetical protein
MSHVSAMMFATVSNVEDIGNPLESGRFLANRGEAGKPPDPSYRARAV